MPGSGWRGWRAADHLSREAWARYAQIREPIFGAAVESLEKRMTMKSTARIRRSSALAAAFILIFLTSKSYGAHVVIGLNCGYSSTLRDVRYGESYLEYTAPKLKACFSSSVGIVFRNHFSLIVETFVQEFDEVHHYLSNTGDVISGSSGAKFLYFGLSLEYRFFRDIRRSWNPYINVGAYTSLYLNLFGLGSPEYPKNGCFRAAVGTRIKLAGPLYLNPQVVYFSGSSSVSFQAGLDFIF
jgi:hypothetical protein